MNKDVMAKTAQLEDFDEQLYKVRTSTSEGAKGVMMVGHGWAG